MRLLTIPPRDAMEAGRGRVGDGVLGGDCGLLLRRRSLRDRLDNEVRRELAVEDGY